MTTEYCHVLEGRLRIKVSGIKRSPGKALQVEALLAELEGVRDVTANATTGNVLVLFCPKTRTHADIVLALHRANYLQPPAEAPRSEPARSSSEMFVSVLGHTLAKSIADVLVRRALCALL